ncbi:threonine-phosphate decarboxylase CobD [Terasakiella pusilla]|uniref:threonine-phosphate decarboxylase CobD n=1 Tax=Terasakiella pusilla TaxID=64973 RepID=UPI003AA9D5F9
MSVFHGGNLAGATEKFGQPKDGWLDLSTGINPNPYPVPTLSNDIWGRLPDHDLVVALKKAAAHYYGVADESCVIPVSGTQTLLQILPHVFVKPSKVRILEPTYKEHAHCWTLAGHDVAGVKTLEEAEAQADIIIVVNPNNPTGAIYDGAALAALAARMFAKGGLLIVDGAFSDCTQQADISAHAGKPGLLILRSFGKFFGLAGIRLGFVLAQGPLADRLKEGIGPWAVNGPALEIGRQAFLDDKWIGQTQSHLLEQAQRLDGVLSSAGLHVEGGTSLFRFCRSMQAQEIYQALGRHGILVRPFADLPDHLRVGLPGNESEWIRLENSLKTLRCD